MFSDIDNYYSHLITLRSMHNVEWADYDVIENYKESTLAGPNPYGLHDISYKYNIDGFRCDDFNLTSELPILFMGCSFTEGTGLPINHIWANLLLERIKVHTGKNIPYWNTALSGASIDAMANGLYWFDRKFAVDLKYIVMLCPPFQRREYLYGDGKIKTWYNPIGIATDNDAVNSLFMDRNFSYYRTGVDLMLIDSIRRRTNASVIYSSWKMPGTETENETAFIKRNCPDFNYVNFPAIEKFNTTTARDGEHFGVDMHNKICDYYWDEYFVKNL